ncbi:MAG: RDD family protein [Chloroflexi bacterium]|nr:RDD family protein [Chloroflexota bacterium]
MKRTGDGNASDPASPRPPEPDTRDLGPPDDGPPDDELPRQPPPRPVLFGGDMRLILRRVGAWLIDFTIAYFVVYVAVSIAGVAPTAEATPESDITGLVVWLLAVPFVYRWAMQSALGYTLGKLGMGLRLVDRDGQPPGPIAVLNREAVQLVLLFAWQVVPQSATEQVPFLTTLLILGPLGDVYAMFRRRDTRALHDLPAGTQVIRVARVDAYGTSRDGPRRYS